MIESFDCSFGQRYI